jgi:xanthine dehydrogenase accessory factor
MNPYYELMLHALQEGNVGRKTIVGGPRTGDEALFVGGRQIASYAGRFSPEPHDPILEETLGAKVQLVLCGGGHVARELYALACLMDMDVSVLDEREEFCNERIYPKAHRYCAPFSRTLDAPPSSWTRPYFVLVTRGHGFDRLCLEKTLRLPHSYIGMIGSKHKVQTTMETLAANGFSPEELSTVHAPIGLPIGAVTASEIAVSVMAEIIGVYRKQEDAVRMDPALLSLMAQRTGYILARVVEKTGSAPCDIGFQIAVFPDGTHLGTVGGGLVEAKTVEHALAMLSAGERNARLVRYDLDDSKAGSLGMICGGAVQILFQCR